MNLVKESLNEMGVSDNSELVVNQVKNVLKNAQALSDLLNTGVLLSPEEGAKLAVIDANIQDIKNRVENESTEAPGDEVIDLDSPGEQLPPSVDIPGEEGEEIIDPIPAPDSEVSIDDELPEPFPEDEVDDTVEFADVEGDNEVEVLDVETKYEDEV